MNVVKATIPSVSEEQRKEYLELKTNMENRQSEKERKKPVLLYEEIEMDMMFHPYLRMTFKTGYILQSSIDMITDYVLTALSSLGSIPDEIKDFGYRFDCEGLTLLYQVDEDEAKCITFSVPDVFDIPEDNRLAALEAMARLSGR